MKDVVRHLVDDPDRTAREFLQTRLVVVRQPARQIRVELVRRPFEPVGLHGVDDIADVFKLAGAEHAGMAGGDLLDRLVPERGMPTMKTGSSDGFAPSTIEYNSGVQDAIRPSTRSRSAVRSKPWPEAAST